MRSVKRSPEPAFIAELRTAHTQWDDLDGADRRRIRDALLQDFGPICAYCQQPCQPTRPRTQSGTEETLSPTDEESIDHFRPLGRFPDLRLDWLNLIYACYRCNQSKGGEWPTGDDMKNRILSAVYRPRYTPVSEYVNPNEANGRRPAHEFFSFNVDSGEIMPAALLDEEEWSISRRTIEDIDLNDGRSGREAYEPDHLFNQRRYHLYLFIERLGADPDLRDQIMQGATLLNQPFSGFISAYLTNRFPPLGRLFQQH